MALMHARSERGSMGRTEKQKMMAGEPYDAGDAETQADLEATHRWLARYNAALAMQAREVRQLLGRAIGSGRGRCSNSTAFLVRLLGATTASTSASAQVYF
jgi:hypothetical protein